MYKNNQVCAVEAANLTTELLVSYFCKEAPIVFITENGNLIGAVTVGDIKRSLREGLPSPERLINRNISRIVLSEETASKAEAERIFRAHPNIQNIPVTDSDGQLLYELVRDEQAMSATVRLCQSYILKAGRYGASEYFSNAFGNIDKIFLTGAKADTLTAIRTMLKDFLEGQGLYNVPVAIEENITQCLNEPESTLIISASFIGAAYLTLKAAYHVNVIILDELYTFAEYSKMPAFTAAVAANLTNLFGYETFIFWSDNCYTRQMIQIMQACGISAYTAKEYAPHPDAAYLYHTTDIVALSADNVSTDNTCTAQLTLSRFLGLAELLYAYNKMTDRPFLAEDYIENSIRYLSAVRSAYGYDTLIHTISCPLDLQLDRQIKAAKTINTVIYPDTGITPPYTQGKCLVDVDLATRIPNTTGVDLKLSVLHNSLTSHFSRYLKTICNNVYLFNSSQQTYSAATNPITTEEYIALPESLPPHFIQDMFGQDSYPLDQLLQDYTKLYTLIRVNPEYIKFPSNYHSRYVNTDTYGNRIVPDVPTEYAGTIWLAGNCFFSGYAVEDAQTCAAFLQKELQNAGYPYRVVNLSCPHIQPYNVCQKLLEQDIHPDDVIIVTDTLADPILQKDCDTIHFNDIISKIREQLGSRRWYWDQADHCSTEGYRITAAEIFQKIRPALQRGMESCRFRQKYHFHLEKPLEDDIHTYLQSVRNMLQQNSAYTKKLAAAGGDSTLTGCTQPLKIGSIVMNCNPFTLGHQYLVETVSRLADIVYLFVVEEDRSEFPFPLRFEMVQKGTAAFDNVFVLPSGKFMISAFTSPGYFTKENPANKCYDTFLDLKIFAHYIAPALNIRTRFVGTEPSDLFTAQYNRDMKEILRKNGVDVIEVPRKCTHDNVISAKYVRKLLADGSTDQLENYVPSTTIRCLRENRYI